MDPTEILLQEDQYTSHEDGCSKTVACDPRRALHRYLMLFFICFLTFGSYFCYDNPAALQDVMIRSLGISETEFMNLYAFYSWPNIVMSFIGGILVDRVFGVALGAIIFTICVCCGQIIFGLGAWFNNIYVMYVARFIFGIGAESVAVTQNTYTGIWFPPSELNFVFGLQLSMSRIGSTVNMVSMQPLNKAVGETFGLVGYKRLGVTLLCAGSVCVFSTCLAIILGLFTRRKKRILDGDIRKRTLLAESSSDQVSDKKEELVEKISCRVILRFPAALWLICAVCVTYYVTVFPFVSLGLVFFERKFELSIVDAGVVNTLIYIISAVASPVFGAGIDFFGRNLHWVLTSVLLTLLCHVLFATMPVTVNPIFIMILMGFAYSILASSLWPLVAYLLPVHQRGTAYGLIQSIQNLGLGVVAIFAGFLVDNMGYVFLEVFFVFCLSISLATVFGLYIWNSQNGNVLNESGASRRAKRPIIKPLDETENSAEVVL